MAIISVGSRCAPPSGSVNDAVDDAEPEQILRGDLHVGRRVLRPRRIAPQDRGRAFRRDHRVDRVLEHQHAVGGGDRDRAAGAALADDDRDVRHAERRGRPRSSGRSPRPGRAPRRRCRDRRRRCRPALITGRPKRSAISIRRTRLAVAFRARHAEIVLEAGLGVGALLLAEHADGLAAEAAEAADDGLVLAEVAVAGERREIGDQRRRCSRGNAAARDGARPASSARASAPHRSRASASRALASSLAISSAISTAAAARGERLQFGDLAFEVGDRLFEIEIGAHRSRHGSIGLRLTGCRESGRTWS